MRFLDDESMTDVFRPFGTNWPEAEVHCNKKLTIFPSPAGMLLTKLSKAGINLIIPGQEEFDKWHPGFERENR
jgi:hypothetical protein